MNFANLKGLAAAAGAIAASLAASPALAQQQLQEIEEALRALDGEVLELSLDHAIGLALERSFRSARAERNLRQSELRHDNARAQYRPRLSTSLSADQSARGFRYESDDFADRSQPTQGEFRGSVNADVSVPIDLSGVIGRQVKQADLAKEVSARDRANVSLDITLEAQSSYLNALRAQNQLDADEGVVRQIEQLLRRSGPRSPIAPFLEVELGNARQAAQNSRENADNAQDGLKQLLRLPPELRLRLTTEFKDQKQQVERERLVERALDGRPDIQAALLKVRQAEISARQVSDHRKPTVRVGAFASRQLSGRSVYGNHDRFSQQGGGLSVSVPFVQWDNGQLRRNREIAQIQREQAEADVQEMRERVAYEVRQQLLAVARAENRIGSLPNRQAALEALQRAERALLTASADEQQALLAQVTNARQAWRSAETATADAYIDYNNAVFRLKRLIGEGYDLDPGHRPPNVALTVPPAGSASTGADN